MGETSPERPTFSSVPPSTRVVNASPGGASQPARLPAASVLWKAASPLLLFNTLQEAAPNTGSGKIFFFFLEERIDESGGEMRNTFGVSGEERCGLKSCVIRCAYKKLTFGDLERGLRNLAGICASLCL